MRFAFSGRASTEAAHHAHDETDQLKQTIAGSDTKIGRYRATLDAEGDPALVAGRIREASTIRATAADALRLSTAPPQRLNKDQIAAIVGGLGSLLDVLRKADPRDKAKLYSRIGLRMTFKPGLKTLKAEIVSSDLGHVLNVSPELDTTDIHTAIVSRELTCSDGRSVGAPRRRPPGAAEQQYRRRR